MLRSLRVLHFGLAKFSKPQKTHYQILEVPTNATSKDIKANFLKLAKIYHPDIYKGADKQRYSNIREAYDVLSSVEKRKEYDINIGLKKRQASTQTPTDDTAQQQNTAESDQGVGPRKGVKLDYSFQKTDTLQDLEEQYRKFFGREVKTPFEEIRIVEQPQFKQMTEAQRIRRRFRQIHNDPMYEFKNSHKRTYDQILNHVIIEKNAEEQQRKEFHKQQEYRETQEYIKKSKRKVIAAYGLFAIVFFPTLASLVTRWRKRRDEKEKTMEAIDILTQESNLNQISGRLKYS